MIAPFCNCCADECSPHQNVNHIHDGEFVRLPTKFESDVISKWHKEDRLPTGPSIVELLHKHPSDKLSSHSYAPLYDQMFVFYRESATRILEIGIERGQSLRAWQEYFQNALIVGIDNEESKMVFKEPRIVTYRCDTTSRDEFLDLTGAMAAFDIIVEDSSHILTEQLFIVAALWSKLKPGGLLIVEDIAKPEYLALFSAFQGVTLHDRRKVRGQHDDMLAVMRKP